MRLGLGEHEVAAPQDAGEHGRVALRRDPIRLMEVQLRVDPQLRERTVDPVEHPAEAARRRASDAGLDVVIDEHRVAVEDVVLPPAARAMSGWM